MKILDFYLWKHFLRSFFLFAFLFSLLFGFFEFLGQLDQVGQGTYTLFKALSFVFLTSGTRLYDLFPVVGLLSTLFALGGLADRNELLAMQAAGFGRKRISLSLLGLLFLMIILLLVLEETLFFEASSRAWLLKARALATKGLTPYGRGFWAKEGEIFLRVERVLTGQRLEGVFLFYFTEDGGLKRYLFASTGEAYDDHWLLFRVEEEEILPNRVVQRHYSLLKIEAPLRTKEIRGLTLPPEFLSLLELWHFQTVLSRGGQDVYRYLLLFWQKVFIPLTALLMLVLALGFVFGFSREKTVSRRVGLGAIFGLFTFLFQQVLAHLGVVYGLPPLLVAFLPAVLVMVACLFCLRGRV